VHFDHHVPEVAARLRKRADSNHLGRLFDATNGPKSNDAKVDATPSLATCDRITNPVCLRALYDFDYTPKATEKNSFGIGEFLTRSFCSPTEPIPQLNLPPKRTSALILMYSSGEDISHSARPMINTIVRKYSSAQVGQRPIVVSIDGGKSPFIYVRT
jgi:hypothetical protein